MLHNISFAVFDFIPTPVGGNELWLQPTLTVTPTLHVGAETLTLSSLPPGISVLQMPGEDYPMTWGKQTGNDNISTRGLRVHWPSPPPNVEDIFKRPQE